LPGGGANTQAAATLGGLVWIGVALVGAYLAYLQWTTAQELVAAGIVRLPDGTTVPSLQTYAAINAVAAAVTLLFGGLLFVSPTRGRLDASAAWAVLSVLGGVAQIVSNQTHWTIFVGTVGAATAGILSFVARDSFPITSRDKPPR
jgi:hypothetical protein